MTVNAAELIQPRGGPPQPAGFFEWVHRGPAFEQGAIPSYLLAGTAEPIPAEDHFMDVERVVDRDLKLDCDVVIVGSGAGGAAAAAELSSAGLRVIVLEEGGYFTREDFSGPPLERVMRLYAQSGATQSFGNRPFRSHSAKR